MKVFYNPNMSTPSHGYSPSGSKPAAAVADWQARGLDIEIVDFEPATKEDLYLAHDKKFVDNVLSCREANGHGNRRPEIAESCRWTVGSMMAAAKAALTEGITCSPSSGFHHAGYAYNGCFCTFNGLMVTAIAMLEKKTVSRVGILDIDAHYGDGTDDIIKALNLHSKISHWTFGEHYHRQDQVDTPYFVRELTRQIRHMYHEGVDLILYQAGADPHVNDPLGGMMTTSGMRQRDRIVFEQCRLLKIPVAWNLAGGYQKDKNGNIGPVLALHRATAQEAIRALAGRTSTTVV